MAIVYANRVENHRAVYFEATGDNVITALTVNHNRGLHAGATAHAFVVTAPATIFERRSDRGGLRFPTDGTPVTVSSVSVAATSLTVNTSAAVGDSTVAYVCVVFDQESASN